MRDAMRSLRADLAAASREEREQAQTAPAGRSAIPQPRAAVRADAAINEYRGACAPNCARTSLAVESSCHPGSMRSRPLSASVGRRRAGDARLRPPPAPCPLAKKGTRAGTNRRGRARGDRRTRNHRGLDGGARVAHHHIAVSEPGPLVASRRTGRPSRHAHRHRNGAIRRRSIAYLAVAVVPPGVDRPIRRQRIPGQGSARDLRHVRQPETSAGVS